MVCKLCPCAHISMSLILTTLEKDTHLKLYCSVLSQVPNFKNTIGRWLRSLVMTLDRSWIWSEWWACIAQYLNSDHFCRWKRSRQQDTNKLKEGLWEFFSHDNIEVLAVPRDKTGWGFNHLGTACALYPHAYIWEFDDNERYVSDVPPRLLTLCSSFLKKITSGEIEIMADQFPNFLYDECSAKPPSEEEEWNVEHGLLHSSLCCGYIAWFFGVILNSLWNIQSYKCIFMGNRFWLLSQKKKNSAVGKINGLTQVTPVTIVYAVTQVCFNSPITQPTQIF